MIENKRVLMMAGGGDDEWKDEFLCLVVSEMWWSQSQRMKNHQADQMTVVSFHRFCFLRKEGG
jgi:hypothetical protein